MLYTSLLGAYSLRQKQRVGSLGVEGFISEMFKHIFLRIPDEVCVFFYSCESIQCNN